MSGESVSAGSNGVGTRGAESHAPYLAACATSQGRSAIAPPTPVTVRRPAPLRKFLIKRTLNNTVKNGKINTADVIFSVSKVAADAPAGAAYDTTARGRALRSRSIKILLAASKVSSATAIE